MTKLSTYWAAAVAYVSLIVGAGLSVAGNLADTYRLRADLVDGVDVALAIGPPLASLLVAELFVSAWPRRWSVQSVRWVATLVVGSLAMIVSWLHIHELLLARGQHLLVATLWPLAIDGLAIMAMAKILVTRGHGQMATAEEWPAGHDPGEPFVEEWPETVAMAMDEAWMATSGHGVSGDLPQRWPHDDVATQPTSPAYAASLATELNNWVAGHEQARTDIGEALAAEATLAMANKPAAPPPVVPGTTPESYQVSLARSVPGEAGLYLAAWGFAQDGPDGRDVDALLAAYFGKSTRTVRRWRSIVTSKPISPA